MLAKTIDSYLYVQYNDDENLQSFFNAYNAATQVYVDWFNQVSLPVYTGLSGSLLDWVAEGLYGLARTSLESQVSVALGPLNSQPLNTAPINAFSFPTSTFYDLSDDAFQRIITWNFYKGDGRRFCMRWLKRRIMRFLVGVNGVDPQPPGFIVGAENTSAISTIVTSSGGVLTLTVRVNQSKLSTLVSLTPGILTIFQLAFLGGQLELPIQYSYAFDIITSPIPSVTPTIINQISNTPTQTTIPAVVQITGGSGPFTYAWTWASGGTGITINTPSAASTTFSAALAPIATATGMAICTITDYFDDVVTITIPVSITNIGGLLSQLALNEQLLNS